MMDNGSVVGINVATEGQGIGWNLAIDQLKPIIEDAISSKLPYGGRVGWLGFDVEEINPSRAAGSFKTELPEYVRKGILVRAVAPDNVGDRAGVKSGDIVYSVNGEIPADEADYFRMMKQVAGKECTLTVSRFGEKIHFEILAVDRAAERPSEYVSIGGIIVQPMSRFLQYWYDMDSAAVYVADVDDESDAASYGAYSGPVRAVAVGGEYHEISSLDDFWDAVKDLAPGEPMELFYGMERIRSIVKVVYYDETQAPERHQIAQW